MVSNLPSQADFPDSSGHSRLPLAPVLRALWARTGFPVRIGVLLGLLGAVLAAICLMRPASGPFSWRGAAMAVVLAGGAWGLVSWAMASAIAQARQDEPSSRDEGGQ